jgi:hypothetical protein
VDAETVAGLLKPHIGEPGRAAIIERGAAAGFGLSSTRHPLTSVEVRPDGLVLTTSTSGWLVFDPEPVTAVEWITSQDGKTGGQYL